jgi:pimeloyl-ACP methyl ester carboxylesterase
MNIGVLCNFAGMSATADVQFFEFDGNRLAFRKLGDGLAPLLAFHGFAQDSQVFTPLADSLGGVFTIYAVDLFFHGHSHYGHSQLLTKIDWQRLIAAFLEEQGVGRFSLMGFSLGGRFALSTMEAFADRLDQLFLIAPDGITPSQWYKAGTRSGLGRWLFRYVLRHLSILTHAGHLLTQLGLLNRTAMRFAEISLGTPEQRALVYDTWTRFRLIQPNLDAVGTLLNAGPVQTRFFTGAFDRLVPGDFILPLTKRLRNYELTILQTGHTHLIGLVAGQLAQRSLQDLPEPDNGHDNEADDY